MSPYSYLENEILLALVHNSRNFFSSISFQLDHLEREVTDQFPSKTHLLVQIKRLQSDIYSFYDAHHHLDSFLKSGSKPGPFNLDQAFKSAIYLVQALTAEEHVTFNTDFGRQPIHLFGFRQGLCTALFQILRNSIEAHTRTIHIEARTHENYTLIRITDNGIGIRPEALPRIFTPGFTTKRNGAGMGLATAKSIIEDEFKGAINVRSNPGRNTIFELHLPNAHE